MTYIQLTYLHLGTIFPVLLIGTYLLLSTKGTPGDKLLGKVYMALMLFTAPATVYMPAEVGPRVLNHFGLIHLLSLLVLYCVPAACFAARAGNIEVNAGNMTGLYIGGILVAGGLTLLPGRLLHSWVFGQVIGRARSLSGLRGYHEDGHIIERARHILREFVGLLIFP